MAVHTRTHVDVDADTTVEVRPPDRPGERVVLIDEWSRHHQIALTFENLAAIDRTIAALTDLRTSMAGTGAAA